MGYRSDVVLAVHNSVLATLPELDSHKIKTIEDATYFTWEDVKWNCGYHNERELFEWMELQEDIVIGAYGYKHPPYGLVRLGEQYGDYDDMGEPYAFHIDVRSEITVGV